jgi:flagellin-like protein
MKYDTQKQDSAVSPVIGVILMVAITVILAAVIGTFVLGLGQNVQENAQAGLTFDSNSAEDNVTISVTDPGNVDALYIQLDNQTSALGPDSSGVDGFYGSSANIEASAGDRVTVDTSSVNAITVLGQVNGENTTIRTYEDF